MNLKFASAGQDFPTRGQTSDWARGGGGGKFCPRSGTPDLYRITKGLPRSSPARQ